MTYFFVFLAVESEEEVSTFKKQKIPTSKDTPTKKSTPTKKTVVGGAKRTAAAPPKAVPKKKEVTSLTDFFGKSPIVRTTRSSGRKEDGVRRPKLEKQEVAERDVSEVNTVPESPTEAAIMEFSDEAVALALQEDIAEMNKEKVSRSREPTLPSLSLFTVGVFHLDYNIGGADS